MRLPRKGLTRVLLVFVLTLSITAGAAFAGGGPVISEAMARFHLDFVRNHPAECQGQDGTYLEDVIHYRGTQDSSTPALDGKAKAVVHSLVNIFTGVGVGFARITIRDPASSKVTSDGIFVGAISAFQIKGIELSRLVTGEALIASFSVTIAPNSAHIEGEFGASSSLVPADLAVVWNTEACRPGTFWRDYQAALASVGR